VHEAGIGRRIGPLRNFLRIGFVGNVQNEHAAVDIGEIATVAPLRIDVGVVGAVALVDRVAWRRHDIVALTRARHPPAADFDRLRRVADIDTAVELVVVWIGRHEIARTGRAMDEFAIAEPKLMHSARMRAGAIEKRNRFRIFRLGNIEQFKAGGLKVLLRRLVSDRHHVAARFQRVRAHIGVRQIGLAHHFRLARIGDVDGGEILRRALMREPDDAPPVRRDLHRHALAHAAEAAEQVVRQKFEIPDDGLIALGQRAFVFGQHQSNLLSDKNRR